MLRKKILHRYPFYLELCWHSLIRVCSGHISFSYFKLSKKLIFCSQRLEPPRVPQQPQRTSPPKEPQEAEQPQLGAKEIADLEKELELDLENLDVNDAVVSIDLCV